MTATLKHTLVSMGMREYMHGISDVDYESQIWRNNQQSQRKKETQHSKWHAISRVTTSNSLNIVRRASCSLILEVDGYYS